MANDILARFKKSDLFIRTISAIVLIPIVLFIVHYGEIPYIIAMLLLSHLMIKEWRGMIAQSAISTTSRILWLAFGTIYSIIPCFLMILIRMNGEGLMFWVLLCVWATDIGAYFAGISIGGPKIAPKISPSKTWAGLGGAVICSGLVGCTYDYLYPHAKFPYFSASLVLPFIAQAGDFLESAVKRYFKVKDSGSLIPGHGGILDRVDGLITAVIFTWIVIVLGS